MSGTKIFIKIFSCSIAVLSVAAVITSTARAAAPYSKSDSITGVEFKWDTHKRYASGSDNWPITWADDGNQYASWGDGGGFGGSNSDGRVSLGFARIEGDKGSYKGKNVWGGKGGENAAQFDGKSYGIVSIAGVLYMWRGPGSGTDSYQDARIYKSTNHAASWSGADWTFTKSTRLIMPTILNFGKDYAGARDQYVYHYFIRLQGDPGSLEVHKPGKIDLARVPRGKLMDKNSYEFFAGLDGQGNPAWTPDQSQRKPVFEDGNGVGWNVSVSYNAGLGRYILCTEHTKSLSGNLGMFEAKEPWGPWKTVYYAEGGNAFGKGHIQTNTFFWNFSNKWMSNNGKDFVLVFSGINNNDSWNTVQGSFQVAAPDTTPPKPMSAVSNVPTRVRVVFDEDLDRASAQDKGNYSINHGIVVDSALLQGDGKSVVLNTTEHQEGVTYTLTIDGVKDMAGNTARGENISYIYVDRFAVTDISRPGYKLDTLSVGKPVYIDRDYTFTNVYKLGGRIYIVTANDDKTGTGDDFLTFGLTKAARVYVGLDQRLSVPSWLSGWTPEGAYLETTNAGIHMDLYSMDFEAGMVSLGGPEGTGAESMYTVVLVPKSGSDADTDSDTDIDTDTDTDIDTDTDTDSDTDIDTDTDTDSDTDIDTDTDTDSDTDIDTDTDTDSDTDIDTDTDTDSDTDIDTDTDTDSDTDIDTDTDTDSDTDIDTDTDTDSDTDIDTDVDTDTDTGSSGSNDNGGCTSVGHPSASWLGILSLIYILGLIMKKRGKDQG